MRSASAAVVALRSWSTTDVGHEPVRPAERGAARGEIDVLVVEEEALVEPAGLAKELRREHHRPAGEAGDLRRRSDDDVERAVADVRARPVATDRDAEAVDARRVAAGDQQLRLSGSDPRLLERCAQRLAPAGADGRRRR